MTSLTNIFDPLEDKHYLSTTYAFITVDEASRTRLYVVGHKDTVIDLSDDCHTERVFPEGATVEDIAKSFHETLLRVYCDFENFCLCVQENH